MFSGCRMADMHSWKASERSQFSIEPVSTFVSQPRQEMEFMVIYKETVYQVVHLVHLKEKRSLFLFQIKAGKKKKKGSCQKQPWKIWRGIRKGIKKYPALPHSHANQDLFLWKFGDEAVNLSFLLFLPYQLHNEEHRSMTYSWTELKGNWQGNEQHRDQAENQRKTAT